MNEELRDETERAPRPGEARFSAMPEGGPDAVLTFIGEIRSPWRERGDCPKNMRMARERGGGASVTLFKPFDEALHGLKAGDWVFLLSFLDRADRDLALQVPRHADGPRGTFTLRSPVRPNPIGLHLVQLVTLDSDTGQLTLDAIDVLDGTPLLDIKPYFASVDAPPGA